MLDHESTCLLGRVPNPVRWEGFQGRLRYANALGVGFHELADLYSSSVRGDVCAFSSSDDVLAPLAVCGRSSKAFCASLTS